MSTGHPHRAAIALGSNLGDRPAHLDAAITGLAQSQSITIEAVSSIIETEPVGPGAQGLYLNAAMALSTSLTPRELLDLLLTIERSRGRIRDRDQRWGPRTLDLDLILFDDRQINSPDLVVPHPRLRQRRFVLEPLAQIAPDWPVPPDGCSVGDLLAMCSGSGGTTHPTDPADLSVEPY